MKLHARPAGVLALRASGRVYPKAGITYLANSSMDFCVCSAGNRSRRNEFPEDGKGPVSLVQASTVQAEGNPGRRGPRPLAAVGQQARNDLRRLV